MKPNLKVNIDKQTQVILKTFTKISEGVVLDKNKASTQSVAGHSNAYWSGFKSDGKFIVSNISKLLKILNSFDTTEVELIWEEDDFTDDGYYGTMQITNGNETIFIKSGLPEYIKEFDDNLINDYSDEYMDYFFEITEEQISKISEFSKLLRVSDLFLVFENNYVKFLIKDARYDSDTYEFQIPIDKEIDTPFNLIFDISEIDFYSSNYKVSVSLDGFIKFCSDDFTDNPVFEDAELIYCISSKDI